MSSTLYLIGQSLKTIKKIDMSTYFSLFLVLLVNLYRLHSTILGKLINLGCILYLILNEHLTFGIIAFLIILLLNNGTVENFENKSKENQTDILPDEQKVGENKTELNDTIATFKSQHCKNGKLVDKDGNEINITDLSNDFPNIQFAIENEKCNPCEDNCKFKITSEVERITVEEKLRPTDSTQISSD